MNIINERDLTKQYDRETGKLVAEVVDGNLIEYNYIGSTICEEIIITPLKKSPVVQAARFNHMADGKERFIQKTYLTDGTYLLEITTFTNKIFTGVTYSYLGKEISAEEHEDIKQLSLRNAKKEEQKRTLKA